MGNLKQRFIKPGRDFNYAEGVKVKAAEAISANEVVYVTSYSGPFLVVSKASAGAATTCEGRLMFAKHDIPANGYGVVLPWKLVTGLNTSAAASAGVPIYLSGSTAGQWVVTAPSGGTTVVRIIGHVIVDDTASAALPGAILLACDVGERTS
jgi:hypothetical protein